MLGAEPRPVPLDFGTDFRLDLDRLFAACGRPHPGDRAVDAIEPRPRLDGLACGGSRRFSHSARRTGIWIVSDEVYGRLYFKGDAAPSILEVAGEDDRVMVVNSFSKAWAMTGWRIGWLNHPGAVGPENRRDDPVHEQRNGRLRPGRRARSPAQRRTPGPGHPGQARGGHGPSPTGNCEGSRPSSCPTSHAAACTRSSPLADEPDSRQACFRILEKARVGLAPGFMFGRFGAGRSCACASCGDRDQLQSALGPDGRSLLMTRIPV